MVRLRDQEKERDVLRTASFVGFGSLRSLRLLMYATALLNLSLSIFVV